MADPILIGFDALAKETAEHEVSLLPRMANRHGLIAGATGTGKTVTLQALAEHFSQQGVPVFLADVKGDMAGIAMPGGDNKHVAERVNTQQLEANFDFSYRGNPVMFWDIEGKRGHPVRTTISEMGPMLLTRLLGLNEVQEGVLNIVFRVADDNQWLLLDFKDLRAMIAWVGENATSLQQEYGNVSASTVGAIQRRLLVMEQQGLDQFFGEPALVIQDMMRTHPQGQGYISVLVADTLIDKPALYATFLLWMISELFDSLPEVGDLDKPKMVFMFDEAHLLFNDTPKVLLDRILKVVRLIRSKGVGIYFVTQNPMDIPDAVLGQLGNRIQHALRAYTPRDQKAVKVAADTFRPNPAFNTVEAITNLRAGEALVSVLDEKGAPTIVKQVLVSPPGSRLGALTTEERQSVIKQSPIGNTYNQSIDRYSAFEILEEKARAHAVQEEQPKQDDTTAKRSSSSSKSSTESIVEAFGKSIARSMGTQVGRQLGGASGGKFLRGLLGALLRK